MHTRHIRLMPVHLHDSKNIHNAGIARYDGFPDFQLHLTISGSGLVNTASGKQWKVGQGDLLFIPPEIGHSYYQQGEEKWMITYITFNGASVAEGLPYAIGLPREISVFKRETLGDFAVQELYRLFQFAADEYFERSYPDDLILHVTLYRIFDLLYGIYASGRQNPAALSSIPEVLGYIRDNLSLGLSIQKISSETGRTISSIYNTFSKEMNMTPWEYITLERLKRVKVLLEIHPEMTVYEAGFSVGMTSKKQLGRCIKKYCGVSPGKYKDFVGMVTETEKIIVPDQLPIYLTSAKELLIQEKESWDHTRKGNTWQLMLCLDGIGTLYGRNDMVYYIRPGYICLFTPETECWYAPSGESGRAWRVLCVQFSGKYAKELINVLRLSSVMVIPSEFSIYIEHRFSPGLKYSFLESFDQICSCSYKTDSASILHCSVLLYELITYVSIASDAANDATGDEKKLLPAIDAINMNYSHKFTLENLSEAAGINIPTLIRLFKNVYNTTPGEYIISVRITRAKRLLLRHPGKYISEIAKQTGFSSSSHFIATFKRYEGMTPEEYRDMYI